MVPGAGRKEIEVGAKLSGSCCTSPRQTAELRGPFSDIYIWGLTLFGVGTRCPWRGEKKKKKLLGVSGVLACGIKNGGGY